MNYDVVVIGGGPGGYSAAEKAGREGLKTLCIEKEHYGGTCLNEGCIPTKAFLYSGKLYQHIKEGKEYGVTSGDVTFDQAAVLKRKDKVVKKLVKGVEATLAANHVEMKSGHATILGKKDNEFQIDVNGEEVLAKNIIIATGSVCTIPPIPGLKEGLESGYVLTNKEFLELDKLPKKMVVLGGGVIGLEMATYMAMVGVEVHIMEMLDHIAGVTDKDLVKALQSNLEAMGMKFHLQAKVKEIQKDGVVYEHDGQDHKEDADLVLLSIGRRANTEGLGVENINLLLERGAVVTDEQMKTNVSNVYAIGDVNGKLMLAHTAYREADVAVNTILGKKDVMRYDAIPSVIYSWPELSSVGETEESAKAKGINVKVLSLPMAYSGRYLVETNREKGMMKLVFNQDNDVLIGAQFLCNYSSEFITLCGAYIEMEYTAYDIQEIVMPHPSVSEIIREAVNQY